MGRIVSDEPRARRSEIAEVASLNTLEDSAVTESIRHILGELDASAESISGWSSFIEKDVTSD